ncbi:MAG: MFS transporter [Chloroflexi bacterium]|nr:MAG: MFS transporter [Chloroflexota bacterium]MBL1197244.1 MFS transporter [Chloroflexota bacterium]NOH14537.1 MFS transporter [Chloroflexota bacterium]
MNTKPQRAITVSYLAFIVLGLYDGILGVVWPSMRDSFGLPLDAVGILLVFGVLGFVLVSFGNGWLAGRFSTINIFLMSAIVRTVGFSIIALSTIWPVVILGGFLISAGAGGIDAGLNTYVARHYRARQMNWLHANFGVGATLGPLLVGGTLALNLSWRWSFAAVVILQIIIIGLLLITYSSWENDVEEQKDDTGGVKKVGFGATLRLPLVWMGVGLFFLTTGTELSAGQWAFPLFTEAREVAEGTASVWVSVYWGSFTLGRFLLGFIVDRLSPKLFMRLSLGGVVLGALLLWTRPLPYADFVGLAFAGFALASIFPILIATTPERVGREHAANAIGFQVAAAGLGGALLTGLAGVLADSVGLEVLGPYLVGTSALMVLLYEGVIFLSKRRRA